MWRAVAACEPPLQMALGGGGTRAAAADGVGALLMRRAMAACEPPLQVALGGGGTRAPPPQVAMGGGGT